MYSRKLNVGRGLRWGNGSRGRTLEVDVPAARSLGGSSWYESTLCRITSVSTTQPQKYGVELVEFAPSLSPLTAVPRATPLPVLMNKTPVGEISPQTWGYNITQMKTAGTAAGVHTGEWREGPTFSVGDLAHLYYLPAAFLPGGDSRNVPNEFLLESLGSLIDTYYVVWTGIEQSGDLLVPLLHVWRGVLSDRTAGEALPSLGRGDGNKWEYGFGVVTDSCCQLHLVYHRLIGSQYAICYRRFDGYEWQESEVIDYQPAFIYPLITIQQDGQPFVYAAGSTGEWTYTRGSNGTWTGGYISARETTTPYAIGFANSGDWYALHRKYSEFMYVSVNGGPHKLVTGTIGADTMTAFQNGDLLIGNDGTLYVGGFAAANPGAYIWSSTDDGTTWAVEEVLAPVAPRTTSNLAALSQDTDGYLHMTFSHNWVGHDYYMLSYYMDNTAGIWQGGVIDNAQPGYCTAMALDDGGEPIVITNSWPSFKLYLYREYPFGAGLYIGKSYARMKVKTCGVRDVSQFVV